MFDELLPRFTMSSSLISPSPANVRSGATPTSEVIELSERLPCCTSIVELELRDRGEVIVLLPEKLSNVPPLSSIVAGRLMPPATSRVVPDSTFAKAPLPKAPKALGDVTRRVPALTKEFPSQSGLFPERIRRPGPDLNRSPEPVSVAANSGEGKPDVPIVLSPVETSSGPWRSSVTPEAAAT